ncbi:hypothetical protein CFC21_069841 [Triticum aestivum]|uniref:DUF3615 domain-containing protein n=3 Tax=Triticum TaxID=4564 RepID=A0A9R0WZ18_TRITD|nr:uncharacterized protein LOC119307258 [Triticum dicoccoides]XP_044386694.1 uncharacterized protein LOC123110283 [Triticum aestivum]KAF7063313.1 hypothetical protein CFC21_069841 [Triticum aestivum]VAI27014.1 unnamed protein product [Triticum turgidum subsp. durum]
MTTSPSVGVYSKSLMESGPDSVRQEPGPFIAPSLEELLPQLSLEERVRLQSHLHEHERKVKRWSKCPTLPSGRSERKRDTTIMPHVRHALHYYNARHPGDEFDAVKPLMESRASFRKQLWAHVNFWARSRKSNKIKRFFAEVHYNPKPIVEVCTIIEEPLDRYRRSCAFCPGNRDILHPVGSRKFVCGNDKDRMVQQFKPRTFSEFRGMPFTCCPSSASSNVQEEVGKRVF